MQTRGAKIEGKHVDAVQSKSGTQSAGGYLQKLKK
jgi:hypothetical protein